ncbi:hypothetical protein WA1_03565 [Scytonema hofmannii PCC 7110]|uniref:Uncharacterized protein n=1 Tax=Scytonema hofmannii PCC 7110 TaxID=128403 RepID=A0A139X922_9CYAN|nr:hypothetical protein [Scytonema hofmannii]KYC41176.1 hypothetical protein WA1_03565 [Scytonema hofmannii PCC 7110]
MKSQVCAQDIKKLLLDHYDISVSERTIVKVMMEIIEEGQNKFGSDGYVCGDDSTLTWSDEHGNVDSKLKGIHKYWWFNM